MEIIMVQQVEAEEEEDFAVVETVVMEETEEEIMPIAVAVMILNAILCVALLIGLPMPIISSSASSITTASTTAKSSSSSASTCWTSIISIFSGCVFHLECLFFILLY